jgi:hypothetical protein
MSADCKPFESVKHNIVYIVKMLTIWLTKKKKDVDNMWLSQPKTDHKDVYPALWCRTSKF